MPLSQKGTKKTHLYLVDIILEQIPDLDIYPNGTRRWFDPLILEEDLGLVDGPSTKTAGNIVYF